jgi:hypothetical protein
VCVCVCIIYIYIYTQENVLDEGVGAPERGFYVLRDHLVLEQARDVSEDDDNGVKDRRNLRVLYIYIVISLLCYYILSLYIGISLLYYYIVGQTL